MKTKCKTLEFWSRDMLNLKFLEKALHLILCMIFQEKYFPCYILLADQISLSDWLYFARYWAATSKTWKQTLDADPGKPCFGPWTQTLKNLGIENLDSEHLDLKKPGPWKTWTLKNLHREKTGFWKIWNKYGIMGLCLSYDLKRPCVMWFVV